MRIENSSILYTLSFTSPRLEPDRENDISVYFALDSAGSGTFVTDLALFIRNLGQELAKWSVLGDPDHLDPGDSAHPVLHDLAYCWDGISCGYGVLQYCASPASTLNVCRNFHQESRILDPLCSYHRFEYFASGIFLDAEPALLHQVFTEMETSAQYVSLLIFLFQITHSTVRELCDDCDLSVEAGNCTKRLPF